jgi:hypothetical protein
MTIPKPRQNQIEIAIDIEIETFYFGSQQHEFLLYSLLQKIPFLHINRIFFKNRYFNQNMIIKPFVLGIRMKLEKQLWFLRFKTVY